VRTALLDTGVLVALLDRGERSHKRCIASFKAFRGQILTTEPVLTEALYLFHASPRAQRTCIDFIVRGGGALVPQSPASLSRAADLMEKYADVPMDFADATLVVLAEETGAREIFTLDARGFRTFRIRGKSSFILLPEP
jgi:uncharacterized protein